MRKNKKGNVGNIPQYVISFVLIGLIVAVGLVVLDKFEGASKEATDLNNGTFTNATILPYNPVNSVSAVYCNASSLIGSGNYTFDNSADTITIKGSLTLSCTSYSANYNYDANTSASTSVGDSIDAITPITTDWLPIIVIVAVVGIILSLILGAFGSFRRK